ncbi:hypothetical protein D3C72_2264170 [compost metagenome]
MRDVAGDGAFAVAVDADTCLDASTLLLGNVGAGILQSLNLKILADRGDDLIGACYRADERGIPARLQCQHVASSHIGIRPISVFTVCAPSATTGTKVQHHANTVFAVR